MDYKFGLLYTMLTNAKDTKDMINPVQYLDALALEKKRLIGIFKVSNSLKKRRANFKDFIKDHYLLLCGFEELIQDIDEPFSVFLSVAITELKTFLNNNYPEIIHPGLQLIN